MSQIILNDKDPNKDAIFEDFIENSPTVNKFVEKSAAVTDAEYEDLFTKIAKFSEPKTFSQFKETIHDVFDGKMDTQLER